MVEQSRDLNKRLEVLYGDRRIKYAKTRSQLTVLSSELEALPGVNASCLIFDEVGFYKDRRLYTHLRSSTLNREQPLTLTISTASDNLEGIGKELFDLALAVRDGVIKADDFLPVIHQAPLDADWTAPATWALANPSLGETIKVDELAA